MGVCGSNEGLVGLMYIFHPLDQGDMLSEDRGSSLGEGQRQLVPLALASVMQINLNLKVGEIQQPLKHAPCLQF